MLLTVLSNVIEQEVVQTAPSNDIIGIGGIIATVVIGVLTCLVTWKLTMKSIKQRKLSYNVCMYPILSNSITKKSEFNIDDLEIKYKDKLLQNPCLLTLEIANIGNEAIEKPPIRISNDSGIEIIPGYFEEVPSGYEKLWKLNKCDQYSCDIELEHINPKQIVKVRFFLDNLPTEKIKIECPMPNVQLQEVAYSGANKNSLKATSYSRANLVLIAITALLFVTINQWSQYIGEFLWDTRLRIPPTGVVIFIMSTLLLSIIFNTYGIPKVDTYLKTHKKQSSWITMGLAVASVVLLAMIIFDFLIVDEVLQIITAIIIVILLSLLIHFALVTQKD